LRKEEDSMCAGLLSSSLKEDKIDFFPKIAVFSFFSQFARFGFQFVEEEGLEHGCFFFS